MKVLRALVLLVLALLVFASSDVTAKRKCRRVRKPWEAMTQQEKDTYVKAVGIAMEKGYFALFTKVHANRMSSDQAHNTCGFLLWHRRLLLAYENMLRSFGPEFSCVTIPVWNVFGAFAMQTQKKCRSIEECSPLLQALGGSKGVDKTLQIESRKFGPNCVAKGPVGKYCDGPGMDPALCTKCIPRGNWASTALPDSLSYSNLIGMLSEVKGAKDLNQNVQHSSHDHVHSALKGVMSSFYSPLDPVFYSLHTTIDMLHHLYYTCNIDGYLSTDDKISLPKAWQSCSVNGGPQVDATSDIVMKYFVGQKEVSVLVDDHLKPFYQGVPNKFFELVDAADIGANSYSYRMTTLLTDLMSNTANAFQCSPQATRRLRESATVFSSINSTNDSEQATEGPVSDAAVSSTKNVGSSTGLVPADSATVRTAQGQSEQTSTDFYYQALEMAKARVEDDKAAREMVELMECKIYNETVAPVEDFTPEFRFEFNIPPNKYPRCYELLVVKKKIVIDVPEWRPLAEEQLHVELAKPMDPDVDVSELDSSHASDIEVEIIEPLVTPAPDTPVATAAPVKKEDIAISAKNAQTPPPTTPAPPTTEPPATAPPGEDTETSTAASGEDDSKPLGEGSNSGAEKASSSDGIPTVALGSEADEDDIEGSKEQASSASGAGSGNSTSGDDTLSPKLEENVDTEAPGFTGDLPDEDPSTSPQRAQLLSSEGSGVEALGTGSKRDELVDGESNAMDSSSSSDESEGVETNTQTGATGSDEGSSEVGDPEPFGLEDDPADVTNGTDANATSTDLTSSIAPVSVNFSNLDADALESNTSTGSLSGDENIDDLAITADATVVDEHGSSSSNMDDEDDELLVTDSSSVNNDTTLSLTPSMTPVSTNFSSVTSGSSGSLLEEENDTEDSSGSSESGEKEFSIDVPSDSSSGNDDAESIPGVEANGTITQPSSKVFVFDKKLMRSANETVATVGTGALPGDDENPTNGESDLKSTGGAGSISGTDDGSADDLEGSSSSMSGDFPDIDAGSTDQDSTLSEVAGAQPDTEDRPDASVPPTNSGQSSEEGSEEQNPASSTIGDEANQANSEGPIDELADSSSSTSEDVKAVGDNISADDGSSEIDGDEESANTLVNSSSATPELFEPGSESSLSGKTSVTDSVDASTDGDLPEPVENVSSLTPLRDSSIATPDAFGSDVAPVPKTNATVAPPALNGEDFSEVDGQTNSTGTVHAAEIDGQSSDSDAVLSSQPGAALYDGDGSEEVTQADTGFDVDLEDEASGNGISSSDIGATGTSPEVSDLVDDATSATTDDDADELASSSSSGAFLTGVGTPEDLPQDEADENGTPDPAAPTRPPARSLLQRLKDALLGW